MNERKLTVSRVYQPSRRSSPVASIRLTGRWLEELGFGIGDRFLVREGPGRIEILADCGNGGEVLRREEV